MTHSWSMVQGVNWMVGLADVMSRNVSEPLVGTREHAHIGAGVAGQWWGRTGGRRRAVQLHTFAGTHKKDRLGPPAPLSRPRCLSHNST